MNPQLLLVLAVIVVLGWFAWGILYNLRRGNAVLRWMQGGLPLIGEKTTLRWLGTSVAELSIDRPRRPFRQMKVMVVMAPRDVPWFWVLAALQARRDLVIFRSQLLTAPRLEFDLVDPRTWTGRMAVDSAQKKGWLREPYQDLYLYAPGGRLEDARRMLKAVEPHLQALSSAPLRLSVRRDTPHLEIHLPLPAIRSQEAKSYFQSLQRLAQEALASLTERSERPMQEG